MKILIKDITIVSPGTANHLKKMDVFVEGSSIKSIQKNIEVQSASTTVVEGKGQFLLPGLCDLYTCIPDPGNETAEDVTSGCRAALAGGFTDVFVIANTNPVVQTKGIAEYIIKESQNQPIRIHPIGAATENLTGNNPVEMYDLNKSGVIAFGNMPHSIQDFGTLVRTLQYTQPLDAVLFDMPSDKNLANNGQVNESLLSVKMGMKGIPAIAEISAIQKVIKAMEYVGGKVHILGVTTAESIQLIKEAKKAGLNVSASTFAHHLLYTEEDIADYDTHFKVYPPLRDKTNQKALVKALKEGVLDAICTQHTPVDIENKDLEFEYAHFGMIGLQTTLSSLYTTQGKNLEISEIVTLLAVNPRKILNLPAYNIEEGAEADFIIFNPDKKWKYTLSNNLSKSANSPLINKEISGAVTGVFTKKQFHKLS